ncbi:hypothetical protein BCON_0228g00130 [Botryotinia convoluta]|uniref:Delta(24(24(1)))-sterol reductase n=1 Tax=Botryotinia convoluta TaxID=54673 RepID=A0A4Z1HJQ9_9HELO|nr:hypothetical protein BCON_0228g00130 [Botryotinia convoluta]
MARSSLKKPGRQGDGNIKSIKSVKKDATEKADDFAREHIIGGWRPGMDHKVDYSGHFEFGGSLGVLALMIGFPSLMYYMWIGATYYDGKFPLPTEGQCLTDFAKHLLYLVYTGAFPHFRAWCIYWAYYIFEVACYLFMPGFTCFGKPLLHEGGKQLKYYCSAYTSFYLTILVMTLLHATGIFSINTILDEFGPILSVAIISGYLMSFYAYFSAFARGAQHRITGYPIYDFFMGAELNPRLFGILDFKMFYEYEQYGYISGEVMFLVMAHFLYANACAKAEHLITTTWDMYQEKMGFMLTFWNMAGVPFSYCHCTLCLANQDPAKYAWNKHALTAFFVLYLFVYWVWDTSNGQKNSFRMMERGTFVKRRTFPQLPWQEVYNPKTITSDNGDTILADGWYGLARKVHYSCDLFFAISWGLITGKSRCRESLRACTEALALFSCTPYHWRNRSAVLLKLGFPELAAADAYKALVLTRYVFDGKCLGSRVWLEMGMVVWYRDAIKGNPWDVNFSAAKFGVQMLDSLKYERKQAYTQLIISLDYLQALPDIKAITAEALKHYPDDITFLYFQQAATFAYERNRRSIYKRSSPDDIKWMDVEMGTVWSKPYPWASGFHTRTKRSIKAANVALNKCSKIL